MYTPRLGSTRHAAAAAKKGCEIYLMGYYRMLRDFERGNTEFETEKDFTEFEKKLNEYEQKAREHLTKLIKYANASGWKYFQFVETARGLEMKPYEGTELPELNVADYDF